MRDLLEFIPGKRSIHRLFKITCFSVIGIFIALVLLQSPYLNWDYNSSLIASVGFLYHVFEWLFFRIAPFLLVISITGGFLTRE